MLTILHIGIDEIIRIRQKDMRCLLLLVWSFSILFHCYNTVIGRAKKRTILKVYKSCFLMTSLAFHISEYFALYQE